MRVAGSLQMGDPEATEKPGWKILKDRVKLWMEIRHVIHSAKMSSKKWECSLSTSIRGDLLLLGL
jgi:hypothetical protein